jgi:hypothetical protein
VVSRLECAPRVFEVRGAPATSLETTTLETT